MSKKKERLLVVGPLPNEKHNCQWGGATILMKIFRDYLHEKKVVHKFVQTNKYVDPQTLQLRPRANQLHFIIHFAAALSWCDTVMFNFSDHGTVNMFPTLSRIAEMMGKRVVLRKFGGSFDIYLQKVSEEKKRRVVDAISHADLIFFETKAGIAHLKTLIGNTDKIHWFPNVRKAAPQKKDPLCFSRKLVYMSHISNEKGVGYLLRAFSMLGDQYELDFYGAIKEKCYEHFNWAAYHVNYMGEVSADEALRKLTDYDILLLPTSYREGYPGIIIEALSAGMPVVSTTVGGIPEIIENGRNGILVEPSDVDGLVKAIRSVDESNYALYCENAYISFCEKFESNATNQRILSLLLKTQI
jgi:glycosyltransferase involved in cell wall biosynthesis